MDDESFMNKHAEYQYLDLLRDLLNSGVYKDDRTGTGVYAIFGRQMRFDLGQGFPLLTTKKLHTRSIFHELIWFLRGDTNIKYLNANNVNIWNEWANENGDLPGIYAKQWRRWESDAEYIDLVPRKEKDKSKSTEPADIEVESGKNECLGKSFISSKFGSFTIKRYLGADSGNSRYLVQFQKTKGLTEASWPNIRGGQVKDPMVATVAGKGFFGNDISKLNYDERLYSLWRNMISRCYDRKNAQYKNYGAKGVTVSDEWLCFSDFIRTVSQVPFYEKWKRNTVSYDIDKDYFGANQYSKKTCIFLKSSENIGLSTQSGNAFRVDGRLFVSNYELARYLNVHPQRVSDWVSKGKRKKIFDNVSILTPPSGYMYRKIRIIDQIENVIKSLKNDPNSRRHIVTAWNPVDVPDTPLTPCHCLFQFYVADGKLSCQLYQRSCDTFLGVPFNIASYALLTHMIAQVCDLDVGEFIWTGGDIHLYSNHVDQARKQIEREPRPFPKLSLNRDIQSIDGFNYEDITIEGYDPHPHIPGKISV